MSKNIKERDFLHLFLDLKQNQFSHKVLTPAGVDWLFELGLCNRLMTAEGM